MAVSDDRHRLEVAERQLTLVQSFVPRIDGKVSALFAIASAQTAVAALNLTAADLQRWYVVIPLAVFVGVISVTFFNLYRCAYPHLDGGNASLVYFNEIAKLTERDFVQRYRALPLDELTEDLCGQIWRNSQIVACKFKYLKISTQFAMASLVPWAFFLLAASLSNVRVPIFTG